MEWYKNMTKQQINDFNKVIAVSVIGMVVVLLIPIAFQLL